VQPRTLTVSSTSAIYLFLRATAYNAIARILCYRPSVHPSVTRVDQSKTVEARVTKFSPYSSPIHLRVTSFRHSFIHSFHLVFREQVSSRNSEGFPWSGALNDGGVGKIGDFWPLSRHIYKTVQDMTKVVIDH